MAGWPKKKILVPIDFSDDSFRALDAALEMVSEDGKIIALHVLPELHPVEFGERYHTVTPESREQHVRAEFAKRLADPRYARVEVAVRFDDPGRGIAEFAEENDIELIVMSSHGRTGLKRLLIGSVAERVVRLAKCPVLVLRDGH